MCGRYSLYSYKTTPEDFEEIYGFPMTAVVDFPPTYNIGPYRDVPIILSDRQNQPYMRLAHWQMVPSFAKEFKSKYAMFNTRDDSFDQKPFWRKLLQHSRCIFPANNFFEWAKVGGQKMPYKFERSDGKLLNIGGIFSIWRDEQQRDIFSASMITVDANPVVGEVHGRMPLILPEQDVRSWLDINRTDAAELRAAIRTFPGDRMTAAAVSQSVNNIKNDSPEMIEPLD
ncbi:MAG: SOS response-associated peptidase [Calditrichaeota bacterium]|nr:SOS response-associated peptidase [Calditrichota bacterium]MCB0270563.1 SOS response-associated peptidase [Calditrichota bacterium]